MAAAAPSSVPQTAPSNAQPPMTGPSSARTEGPTAAGLSGVAPGALPKGFASSGVLTASDLSGTLPPSAGLSMVGASSCVPVTLADLQAPEIASAQAAVPVPATSGTTPAAADGVPAGAVDLTSFAFLTGQFTASVSLLSFLAAVTGMRVSLHTVASGSCDACCMWEPT